MVAYCQSERSFAFSDFLSWFCFFGYLEFYIVKGRRVSEKIEETEEKTGLTPGKFPFHYLTLLNSPQYTQIVQKFNLNQNQDTRSISQNSNFSLAGWQSLIWNWKFLIRRCFPETCRFKQTALIDHLNVGNRKVVQIENVERRLQEITRQCFWKVLDSKIERQ